MPLAERAFSRTHHRFLEAFLAERLAAFHASVELRPRSALIAYSFVRHIDHPSWARGPVVGVPLSRFLLYSTPKGIDPQRAELRFIIPLYRAPPARAPS